MQDLTKALDKLCHKAQSAQKGTPFQVLIHSDTRDLHYVYPPNSENEIFHIAGIGKLIVTVYLLRLQEKGELSLTDPLVQYLDPSLLEGLFVSDLDEITLWDCLTHRSGVTDYLDCKAKKDDLFTDLILNDSYQEWNPEILLAYVRENCKPVGPKGKQFAYGDTAFILLIMAIQKTKGRSIHRLLAEEFFRPLKMTNTQSMVSRNPVRYRKQVRPFKIGSHEVPGSASLAGDQADGGIVSSPMDLLKFQTRLYQGKLISRESLDMMLVWQGKVKPGIDYGMGLMRIRFEAFLFMIGRLPRLIGHSGVLSTHAFYDPVNDLHFILNFGSTQALDQSYLFLSQLVRAMKKAYRLKG